MSHVICPKCGREVPVGFKSCSNCDQKLDNDLETPSEEAVRLAALAQARADRLEAEVAYAEGRFDNAKELFERAYKAAQRADDLSELARASNGLSRVVFDLGNYEAAQYYVKQALEISERTGDAELIARTHSNLGRLAMSRGDLDTAQKHFEQALAEFQAIRKIDLATTVKANLALCALEEGDSLGAIATADEALAMLRSSSNAGQVLAILGEGRLECGDVLGAQREFDRVLQDYDEEHHPLVVAQARRGLGRVALMRGVPAEALNLLERALAGFERLKRVQEAARTMLYRAKALWQLEERQRACAELKWAHGQFVAMKMRADRDAKRAERLLREQCAASHSQSMTFWCSLKKRWERLLHELGAVSRSQ